MANVETLVVIDHSIYDEHKKYLETDNEEQILNHIRLYYIHSMSGVNDKYQNSLENDPELRINIKLVHILIIIVVFFFNFFIIFNKFF